MGRVRSGLGYGEGLGGAVQTLDRMPPHTGVRELRWSWAEVCSQGAKTSQNNP